jgi:LacI family transcriptional regulator
MSLVIGGLVSPVVEQERPRLRARRASRVRHVALTLPMGSRRFHDVLRGVVDWASGSCEWALTTFSHADDVAIPDVTEWHGDGLIGAMRRDGDQRALTRAGLCCVNVNAAFATADLPLVTVDDEACGRLAAEHLVGCGFRHFAFYGLRGSACFAARHDAFVNRVRELRPDAAVVASLATPQPPATAEAELMALTAWLRRIATPVGLFAANEQLARRVLDACRALRLRVPEQVAVLGVDDDLAGGAAATAAAATESLSTIACDWWRVGYEAAALLDGLMRGGPDRVQERLIQPVGLMKRASTDVVLVENQSVAKAVEFVHSHVSEVFGVEALLRVTGAPRRTLELEFKRSMGCTPYQFIARARVARAKALLSTPAPMKLTAIATACGFADLRRFRLVFRRETGTSPADYRAAQLRQPQP